MKNLSKFAFKGIIFLILTFSFTLAYDISSFAPSTVSTITGADSFGNSVSCTGDVDKDGYDDLIIGAYGKNGNTGAVYIIYGGADLGKSPIDVSTPLNPLATGFMITGVDISGQFGWAVSSGDVDQDGYDDIIIGAPYAGTSSQGIVYVIYGCSRTNRASINLKYLIPSSNGFQILGDVANGQFGFSVSTGDINKDGYADIIIGACGENTYQGAAYIVYGGGSRGSFAGLTSSTLAPTSTGFQLKGKATGTYFGWSVSLGDINNDLYPDIVVGAPGPSSIKGVVYVIYGGEKSSLPNVDFSSQTLSSTSSPPGFTITGISVNDLTGYSVSVGKIDEDLYGDIVIGAPQANSNIGSVYTVFGSGTRLSNIVLTGTLGGVGFTVTGKAGDYFGTSVSAVGNLNKDAYQDIVIGAKGGLGAVYVQLGGVRTSLSSQSLAGTFNPKTYSWVVSGISTGGLFGVSVSTGGDVNNDGYPDIIIGASGESKAYLLVYSRCPVNCDNCAFASKCTSAGCVFGFTLTSTFDCICPTGKYVSGTSCSSCTGSCTACSGGPLQCTACSSPQLAYNNGCTSSCPTNTYSTATTCGACPSNCNTCSSSTVCITCLSSSYLYQSLCYNPCPVTTYASGTICSACPINCDYCSDSSTCTTCSSGFSLSGSTCVPSCPVTQYYNGAVCSSCMTHCDYCSGPSICTACSSSYYLYQNGCELSCPVKTRATTKTVSGTSIKICEDCPSNCDACSSSTVCTTCTSPNRLYLNQCYTTCPLTTYGDTTTTCAACPTNCNVCTGPTTCTTCTSGFNPSGGVCIPGCPLNTYDDGTGACAACPTDCDTCTDSNTCTLCTSPKLLYQGRCSSTCPLTSYHINTTACGSCPTNCDYCSDPIACTGCSTNYFLYQSHCENSCPLTTYPTTDPVNATAICAGCPANCDRCGDSNICDACTPPYRLYRDACTLSCPTKTYTTTRTEGSVSIAICGNCSANCDSCNNTLTCGTCSSGYYGKSDSNGNIISCSTNCSVCNNSTMCTNCNAGSHLYQNRCENPCPVKSYANSSTTCADCPSDCNICNDSSTCTTCTSPFNLYQNGCVGTCPSKTYAEVHRVCSNCPNNCDQCSDSSTCTKCLTNFLMYESQCYSSCPLTTYRPGSLTSCQNCPSNCDTCTSGTSCTACSNGFYLWEASCYNSCPTKTYLADSTSSTCGGCPSNCDQCSSGSVCSSCSANFFSYKNQCFSSCPRGTYADGYSCSDCQENCAKCIDSTQCQSCVAGYLFSGPDCVDKCPLGFYPSSGVCHVCPLECSECTSESNCQSCTAEFVKYKSKCLTSCPPETYLENSACFDCSEGCLKCKSAKECQVCEDGYILSDSHVCVQNIEETAKDKAPPALFESTSLISASMTSGSSLPLNFGLVAKILRNIKYMDLTVSADLQRTFYSWKVATGFMSAPESLRQTNPSKGLPNVFGRYALDPVFLVNFWKPFFMTIIGLGLFAIFKALEIKFEKQKEKKVYSISRQINVAASNFALTQFYSNLDDVILYFAIQLRSTQYDSAFGALSCGIAIVLAMIGVIVLSFHSSLLGKYQSMKQKKSQPLETFTQKYENYKLIYNDFKDTNYLTQSFLFFNLLRALISSLIIATLYQSPGLQIALLLILNLAMLTFLSMRKPFKELVDTCGQIFCELVLLIANISVLILIICDQGDSSHYNAVERLSQCIIVLNFILLFGCATLLLINVGKMLYKAYKEKKMEKKKSLDKSQASTNMKSLFDSAKFSRPNQSLENKTDQSLMPITANDISGELFNNNASRMYRNNNKSPDLSFTQNNITGFESPEILFKQEPMMVSDSYIVENPLDFESEIMEKKNSLKASNEPIIKPVNMTKQMEEDFGETSQGKFVQKNSLNSMDQSVRRRGGKVRILRNSPKKKLNLNDSPVEMDVINLDDTVQN